MRSINERWQEADIQALIDEAVEEGQHLDYKDSRALSNADWKKDVCKDVSAMANADGGVIIYGVTEEEFHEGKKRKIRPQGFDNGVDPAERSKEQIVQVINDGLQRRPEFFIDKVELSAKPGRVCYVIRVPKSLTGAHQLTVEKDYRYYQRQETETKAMQDWQIRDVMNRQSAPDLWMRLEVDTVLKAYLTLKFFIKNHSIAPAEYFKVTIWLDRALEPSAPGFGCILSEKSSFLISGTEFEAEEIKATKHVFPKKPKVPVFGESEVPFPNGDLSEEPWHVKILHYNPTYTAFLIRWMVEAPGMLPRYGIEEVSDSFWEVRTVEKGVIVNE